MSHICHLCEGSGSKGEPAPCTRCNGLGRLPKPENTTCGLRLDQLTFTVEQQDRIPLEPEARKKLFQQMSQHPPYAADTRPLMVEVIRLEQIIRLQRLDHAVATVPKSMRASLLAEATALRAQLERF